MSAKAENEPKSAKSAVAHEPNQGLNLDHLERIAAEKENGVRYTSDDPDFRDPNGDPWMILLTDPSSPAVQRRVQFLERKWRREHNFRKLSLRTPYNVSARLSVRAIIEHAMVAGRFGWTHKGKPVIFDTFDAPETLSAAREALIEVATRIDRVRDFVDEAVGAYTDYGEEELEGEG